MQRFKGYLKQGYIKAMKDVIKGHKVAGRGLLFISPIVTVEYFLVIFIKDLIIN